MFAGAVLRELIFKDSNLIAQYELLRIYDSFKRQKQLLSQKLVLCTQIY